MSLFWIISWKGPSDGLDGVIKSLALIAIFTEKVIIRDGKELYDFLIEGYTLRNIAMFQEKHCVMDHQFCFIKEGESDSFWNGLENNLFKTFRGNCKLHHIICHKSIKNHQVLVQKYAYLCDSCNTLSMEKCENCNTLGTFCERIMLYLDLKKKQSR